MKLVGSKTSPYVRKIRVILAEKKLAFDFVEESAWTAETTVPRYNPLNKVPALVMDDGEAIYDSAVISEYLDAISGGGLIPAGAAERARARRDEALGDGIADAGITAFLERKREAARQDPAWIARQLDKVNAGIARAREDTRQPPIPRRRAAQRSRHRLRLRALLGRVPHARAALARRAPGPQGLGRAHGVAALVRSPPARASGSRRRPGRPRRRRAPPIAPASPPTAACSKSSAKAALAPTSSSQAASACR